MDKKKYIAMDVHQSTISVAVRDAAGKLVMESVIETKADTILDFIKGVGGSLWVTFEEGTQAAWLHDLLKPHVTKVIVCDPRKNALLKKGNKNDLMDARKLSQLVYMGLLSPVYHADEGVGMLREVARSYLTLSRDLTRVMNRLKAIYRGRGIPCAGKTVYSRIRRDTWLNKLPEGGVRRRAEWLYSQLDSLAPLHREIRCELVKEGQKHRASKVLSKIPRLGPIRVALLIALLKTPHRFRTKRQLWGYCGLGLETRISAEYQIRQGQVERSKRRPALRGLNKNHNHDLKDLFKSTATKPSRASDVWSGFYEDLVANGMKPYLARLTLARKIAAVVLKIWKKGERFDPEQLKRPTSLSA